MLIQSVSKSPPARFRGTAIGVVAMLLLLQGCGQIVGLDEYHLLPPPATAWTSQFGTNGDDSVRGVQVDGIGNAFVAGWVGGALEGKVSKGLNDAFLRKYDFAGNQVWTTQFGTSGYDDAELLRLDAEGNLLVAFQDGTVETRDGSNFDWGLRKFSPTGIELWSRPFANGDGESRIFRVNVGETGDAIVIGTTSGTLPNQPANAGADDVFVRAYAADGTESWTRQFGTEGADSLIAVDRDHDGNIFVAGYVTGTLRGEKHEGLQDAFVRKYDPRGDHFWTHQFGSENADYIGSLRIDHEGQALVGGQQDETGFVRKYDSGDEPLWSHEFGWRVNSVTVDEVGNVWAVAKMRKVLQGVEPTTENCPASFVGNECLGIRKYDSDGTKLRDWQLDSNASDYPLAITIDARGSVVVGGSTLLDEPKAFVMSLVSE